MPLSSVELKNYEEKWNQIYWQKEMSLHDREEIHEILDMIDSESPNHWKIEALAYLGIHNHDQMGEFANRFPEGFLESTEREVLIQLKEIQSKEYTKDSVRAFHDSLQKYFLIQALRYGADPNEKEFIFRKDLTLSNHRDNLAKHREWMLDMLSTPDVWKGSSIGMVGLVYLNRIYAINMSLRLGYWVVPNSYPDKEPIYDTDWDGPLPKPLNFTLIQILNKNIQSHIQMFKPSDDFYSLIEEDLSRFQEFSNSIHYDKHSGKFGDRMFPLRRGYALSPVVFWNEIDKLSFKENLLQELDTTNQILQSQNNYHVVFRNCSTELVETHEKAIGNPLPSNIHRKLALIPAQSSFLFENESSKVIPSYRIQNKKPNQWENITLLSSTYRYHPRDGFFIFFTDETILPRPLMGFVNTLAGLGQLGWGVLKLPFDQGQEIKSAGNSLLYSLPELIFFNIRKGNNEPIGDVTIPEL
jgi:hypothetical protein